MWNGCGSSGDGDVICTSYVESAASDLLVSIGGSVARWGDVGGLGGVCYFRLQARVRAGVFLLPRRDPTIIPKRANIGVRVVSVEGDENALEQ